MGTKKKKHLMLHTFHSSLQSSLSTQQWRVCLLGQLHYKHTQREISRVHMVGGLKSRRPRSHHATAVSALATHSHAHSRLAAEWMVGKEVGGCIILINIYRSILLDKKKIQVGEVDIFAYGTGQS